MPEYSFKNGFKVLVPEDLTKAQAIEEWASVSMYMAVMLHPVTTMKKEKPKSKKKSWRAPKRALLVPRLQQEEEEHR